MENICVCFSASPRIVASWLSHASVWKARAMLDPLHGGLNTPRTFAPPLESAGMEVADVAGGTPWHYYACRTR